ncbi:MAG: HEAT repeat domain-containing protein [Planctomycetaceae bacterium]|nr:HEAT repeat domain-containing protein [Planctomycetaceae bacterium]
MKHTGIAILVLAAMCLMGGCKGDQKPMSLDDMMKKMKRPSPTEAVAMAFDPEDPDRARKGITELARHDWGLQEPHLKGYATILRVHPNATVRCAAVRALGKAGDPTYAKDVIKAMEDSSSAVRWDAAIALGQLAWPDGEKPLREHALKPDEEPDVRGACAAALGSYFTKTSMVALIQCLGDEDAAVSHRAHRSLINITGGVDMGSESAGWRGVEKFVTLQPPEKPRPWYDAAGMFSSSEDDLPPSDIAPLPPRPTTRPASRPRPRPVY